jgi:hypothetical protein
VHDNNALARAGHLREGDRNKASVLSLSSGRVALARTTTIEATRIPEGKNRAKFGPPIAVKRRNSPVSGAFLGSAGGMWTHFPDRLTFRFTEVRRLRE